MVFMACSCCGQTTSNVYVGHNSIPQYRQLPECFQSSNKGKWEFQSQKSALCDTRQHPAPCTDTEISFGYHGQPHALAQYHNYPVHQYTTFACEKLPITRFQQKMYESGTTSLHSMINNRITDSSQVHSQIKGVHEKENLQKNHLLNKEVGSQYKKQISDKFEKFAKPSQPNVDNVPSLKKPPILDESLRIITIQIKRLRGISVQLKRCLTVDILFEIIGKCISHVEYFTHLQGFQFVLQELRSNISGATVNCAFYDFDEISPNVQSGMIYRCVGKYHSNHRVFQCFMIEECDAESVRLMELFESHSDREVAKLIEASNKNAVTNSKAVKIPYMGLEPQRYSRKGTGNDWGQQTKFAR